MVTIPKVLLEKVCEANGGLNGDAWYCKNTNADLVLDYSVTSDFFSLETPKEVQFCRNYKVWYDRQFCGQHAKDVSAYVEKFKVEGWGKIVGSHIPSENELHGMLVTAMPSNWYRNKLSEHLIKLSRNLHVELVMIAKGSKDPPVENTKIIELLMSGISARYHKRLKSSFANIANQVREIMIELNSRRLEHIELLNNANELNDRVQTQCYPDRQECLRETNNYCTEVIAQNGTASLSHWITGTGVSVGTLLNWKRIWNGIKWTWKNKGRIANTLDAISSMFKKLGEIWSKKDGSKGPSDPNPGGEVPPPRGNGESEIDKQTNHEEEVGDIDTKKINIIKTINPLEDNVRNQLITSSTKIKDMSEDLQKEMAKLAIEQWHELQPQKQARFLTKDATLPLKGNLPDSYIKDFIERSERSPGAPDGGGSGGVNVRKEDQERGEIVEENFDPEKIVEKLTSELDISEEEAKLVVEEGKRLWEELPFFEKQTGSGEMIVKPTYKYLKDLYVKATVMGGSRDVLEMRREERREERGKRSSIIRRSTHVGK